MILCYKLSVLISKLFMLFLHSSPYKMYCLTFAVPIFKATNPEFRSRLQQVIDSDAPKIPGKLKDNILITK